MKKLYILLLVVCSIAIQASFAQTRYLNPVFTNVTVTTNVPYGQNATVLAFPTIIKQPLIMDFYQQTGDTETARPVILYLHTGNFLPFKSPIDGSLGFNGSCGGTLRDSSVIEACTQLAKMGYVVCALDYRLGWNPIAASDVDRRYGIINAAYRGVQDLRTCIRYHRKLADLAGNPYKIDTDRIVIWGQGTGGYITLATSALDNYSKIPLASDGKFLWDHDQNTGTPPIPMVIQGINGDIYGTSVGLNPTTGDTLCYPNHVGYSSGFALSVNMGGACADSAWVDPGQPPMISFHVPYDNFAPYAEGIVNVPGTNLQVVKVQGSYTIQQMLEANGNNASYIGQSLDLKTTQEAQFAATPILLGNDWTDPAKGLYPFLKPIVQQTPVIIPSSTAPWEWSGVVPNNPTCNTNKATALAYLDTIYRFYAPRGCFALGLQPCIDQILSAKEPLASGIDLQSMPNPAVGEVTIVAPQDKQMLSVQMYDRTGHMVRLIQSIENDRVTIQRENLLPGYYIVKANFKEGFATEIVLFQ